VYGEGYRQLRAHALLYVHATEVGGTHPALIEAMAAARPVLYLDTIENREAAADSGLAFSSSPDDLAAKMQLLLDCPEERQRLAALASERARRLYDWEEITTAYEELFEKVSGVRCQVSGVGRSSPGA
jgi:glycosyltransferase involved in cell wall biosynthesis